MGPNETADYHDIDMTDEQWAAWEQMANRPARDLPRLREFLDEPSQFSHA
ncbi:MAG: hypothetical protein KTV68_16925 [Acidimicrobiia bacterium]|nr:hypothetical protein [Acidimicrobiia bacterium]